MGKDDASTPKKECEPECADKCCSTEVDATSKKDDASNPKKECKPDCEDKCCPPEGDATSKKEDASTPKKECAADCADKCCPPEGDATSKKDDATTPKKECATGATDCKDKCCSTEVDATPKKECASDCKDKCCPVGWFATFWAHIWGLIMCIVGGIYIAIAAMTAIVTLQRLFKEESVHALSTSNHQKNLCVSSGTGPNRSRWNSMIW